MSFRSVHYHYEQKWFVHHLRSHLYGLGQQRQPSFQATLAKVTISFFLSKIQPAVYIRIANWSWGARQPGWASCLTSAGRVTLASGTTFLHINALARLTRTTLGFKAEICIKEVKINSAKPTVIEWPRKTRRKRDICTFHYSVRVWLSLQETSFHI